MQTRSTGHFGEPLANIGSERSCVIGSDQKAPNQIFGQLTGGQDCEKMPELEYVLKCSRNIGVFVCF